MIQEAYIFSLEQRLAELERLVARLTMRETRTAHQAYMPLSECAKQIGLSVCAVDFRLRRESTRPDGFPVRRLRGLVHRGDWQKVLRRRKDEEQLAEMPYTYQGIYIRAISCGSRAAAVKAFCLKCAGWQREEGRACKAPAYPFFPYRAYKG